MIPMSVQPGATVLIVDDDPALLRLLRAVLSHAGYQALTVSDGAVALEQMGQTPPSLVIVDLNMPRMDGEALILKARQAGYYGPFLIVSADFAAPSISTRLSVPLLAKPFDPAELVEMVTHLVFNGAKPS